MTKKAGGYFGINAQEISNELARQLEIHNNTGVIVADVEEGSPADV
jgi:S1-C subfamily serine protease